MLPNNRAILPCIIFAHTRAEKMKRVLDAIRLQGVDRLIVFVDGPRNNQELPRVEACRQLARQVDWAPVELHLWEQNRGLPGLADNISLVLEQYPWAVFVEDDCLPVPGFYAFMAQALAQYQQDERVFSIGGYQPLSSGYFHSREDQKLASLVSCARFTCWGWATWRDRWQQVQPLLGNYQHLFNDLEQTPEIAGADLPVVAREMAAGRARESWDVKVALACLALKKVHWLPVNGLVRNIGQDRSGIHGGLVSALRDMRLHNLNVALQAPENPDWPQDSSLDCDYAVALKEFVRQAQGNPLRRMWKRGRVVLRRYLLPGKERYLDVNLASPQAGSEPGKRYALFSYIVHPFSIPRDDPRFLRHINIWHAQEIVRTLNRMGYNVDVIDYRDTTFRANRRYDLFIGHGGINFEKIASQLPTDTKKLYFSTGAYWKFHNAQEQARFDDLRQRQGIQLAQDRFIQHSEETALRLADGILGIGNGFTRQTYAGFPRVVMVNGASLYDDMFDWCSKDYAAGRAHFFFFSGGGNVHKGLDLLLEAFDGLEQHLWIGSTIERPFEQAFARQLHTLPNIHGLGYVQPRGRAFYQTMRMCNFCVLPSCSEGQSQAVIEAMNQGLIPVVSREAGVDLGDFGVQIEPCTISELRALVQRLSAWSPEECQQRSLQARQAAQQDYSERSFGDSFQRALQTLLGQ